MPVLKELMTFRNTWNTRKSLQCRKKYTRVLLLQLKYNKGRKKTVHKVLPLLAVSSPIKVHHKKVPIDSLLLFQQMSITATSDDEIEKYFEYELAPYPLSLLDDIGMHKTEKLIFENVSFNISMLKERFTLKIFLSNKLIITLIW